MFLKVNLPSLSLQPQRSVGMIYEGYYIQDRTYNIRTSMCEHSRLNSKVITPDLSGEIFYFHTLTFVRKRNL